MPPRRRAAKVPSGYSAEVAIVVGRGVTDAMFSWGDVLLSSYGKAREAAWQKDFTLQKLGYSTDNGAYYYYNTGEYADYLAALVAVKAYADGAGLPYAYVLLDWAR